MTCRTLLLPLKAAPFAVAFPFAGLAREVPHMANPTDATEHHKYEDSHIKAIWPVNQVKQPKTNVARIYERHGSNRKLDIVSLLIVGRHARVGG